MSTLSTEENNTVMSEEDSCSYPDESELELGLELSLGGGGGGKAWVKPPAGAGSRDRYGIILTANESPPVVSAKAAASSSSSSFSPVAKANNNGGGTKRAAEPSSPPGRSAVSRVVGWPPVSNRRMNTLGTQSKLLATEDSASTEPKCRGTSIGMDKISYSSNQNNNVTKDKRLPKTSFFVKVNMDGIPIGRKVDLNAHSCYKTLAHMLDDMFKLDAAVVTRRSNLGEPFIFNGTEQSLRLLDGSSDFVLTYEDKEGDWMLVGDVPWEMFLSSVRRLRIRRSTETI
ncbi:auxin-responsive protein IAA13-like isoform X2 [Andrographis paniculata]|uniref:auxin-responsive protein IAA13-like isoform X2 n=1 Tax=Andrographis paniculata TaxID=175694 RepID=UPI0021E81A12|nr:auxin-responsive protein IAA13-like isoform X2 [Andrographis paniculata]